MSLDWLTPESFLLNATSDGLDKGSVKEVRLELCLQNERSYSMGTMRVKGQGWSGHGTPQQGR